MEGLGVTEGGKTRVAEPEGDGLDFFQARLQPFVQVMSPRLSQCLSFCGILIHFILLSWVSLRNIPAEPDLSSRPSMVLPAQLSPRTRVL